MKLFRRHIAPMILAVLMIASIFSSCQRKQLWLAQNGTLDINVSVYDIQLELLWGVNWKTEWQYLWDESDCGPIGYTEPQGVQANVYFIDEAFQRNWFTNKHFHNSSGGRVSLTTNQTYDMLFHNDDYSNIIIEEDRTDYTYYHATTRTNNNATYTRASYVNYNQPDQLFGTFLQKMYVSDDPEDYVVEKDEYGNPIYVYQVEATLTPFTMIYLYQVMILNNYDEKGQRVAGAEGITANGMSGGVELFSRITDDDNMVSITQDDVKAMQTNRDLTLPDGTQVVGDIMAARMQTWGLPGIDPLATTKTKSTVEIIDSTYVGVGLKLRNGAVYPIQQNVTEQMKQRPSGGVITLVIDAAAIPDSIIGGKPQPGGGFDASVDDWENEIESDITI